LPVKPTPRLKRYMWWRTLKGLLSYAGVAWFAERPARSGLTGAPSQALAPTPPSPLVAHPWQVRRDLMQMLCDGGDCTQDLAELRGHSRSLAPVASGTMGHRCSSRSVAS
jgi:hypothetical protein